MTEKESSCVKLISSVVTDEEAVQHAKAVRAGLAGVSENVAIVALLHDMVEDKYWTLDDIEEVFDLNSCQITAIRALTRDKDEKYFDYIRRVGKNPVGVRVKLSDLRVNMRRCLENDDNVNWSLLRRYAKAYAILKGEWNND